MPRARARERHGTRTPAARAPALMALGSIVFFQGDFERADKLLRRERDVGCALPASRRSSAVALGLAHDGRDGARRSGRRRAVCGRIRRGRRAAGAALAREFFVDVFRRTSALYLATSIEPAICTSRCSPCAGPTAISGEWGSSSSISPCCGSSSSDMQRPEPCRARGLRWAVSSVISAQSHGVWESWPARMQPRGSPCAPRGCSARWRACSTASARPRSRRTAR